MTALWPDLLRGAASGLLLALSFPKFGHPAFAWVALVPWILALHRAVRARGESGLRAFILGLVMGGVYFSGTLYWIPDVLVTFGDLPRAVAVPVAGLLVAYLALYPALASWIVARVLSTHGLVGLWIVPCAWVGTEWLRGWLFTGFPWVSLGYSQVRWPEVAQVASLGGVWALSAVVAAGNTMVASLILGGQRSWRPAAAVGVSIAALIGWGGWRLAGAGPATETSIRVGIIQGNVPQDQKWSPEFAREIFDRYLRLSREAAADGARLIVWPESATPFYFEEAPAGGDAIRRLAKDAGAWVLFGSDQIERGDDRARYYNAAFLVTPDGATAGVYRKRRLVPFGEYVPLKSWLFFVAPLVEAVSDFSPGTDAAPLPVAGRLVSAAICYEAVFGDLALDAVRAGSQVLVTVTNDAWYGSSSAPWQHFEQASLRAIEQGRYLVRAANTGVSGIVDPLGRVVARRGLFETGIIVADVGFVRTRTVYSTIGDSFAWSCAAVALVGLWRRPAPKPREDGHRGARA